MTIKIRNWNKWQSYRKDRGQPPWIKLWRCLLRNPDFLLLTDAQRGQLACLWILAADHNGVIKMTPDEIMRVCGMSSPLDLNVLKIRGFIDFGVTVASPWRRGDASESESSSYLPQKTSSSSSDKKKKDGPLAPARRGDSVPCGEIVRRFNEIVKPPRPYRTDPVNKAIAGLIRARWAEGMREPDFEQVAVNMLREWSGNAEMVGYIRPHTLYTGKMESYLQMTPAGAGGHEPAWKRELIEEMSQGKNGK